MDASSPECEPLMVLKGQEAEAKTSKSMILRFFTSAFSRDFFQNFFPKFCNVKRYLTVSTAINSHVGCKLRK
jgi:hypothetical protein